MPALKQAIILGLFLMEEDWSDRSNWRKKII
jgi:hypothetical protein